MRFIYGILVLLLGTSLAFAASSPDKPFTQELKPGERSLKNIPPQEGELTIYKVPTTTTCMSHDDGIKFIQYSLLQPIFVSHSNQQTYILFVNTQTKAWSIMIIPEPNAQNLICMVGGGIGFSVNSNEGKDINESK